jgi:hypothetical protein
MPSAQTSVPHQLSREEALARIQKLLGELRSRYGAQITEIQEVWDGSHGRLSFKAIGFQLHSEIRVEAASVEFHVQFPLAGLPFKSTILTKINETATSLLA